MNIKTKRKQLRKKQNTRQNRRRKINKTKMPSKILYTGIGCYLRNMHNGYNKK